MVGDGFISVMWSNPEDRRSLLEYTLHFTLYTLHFTLYTLQRQLEQKHIRTPGMHNDAAKVLNLFLIAPWSLYLLSSKETLEQISAF